MTKCSGFRWLASAIVLVNALAWGAEASGELFVHLSDTHLMDLRSADPKVRQLRLPAQPSTEALAPLLQHLHHTLRPAFVLHSGDVADGYSFQDEAGKPVYGQIELAQRAFAGSPIPIYAVLGNHDLSHYAWNAGHTDVAPDQTVAGAARAAWALQVPCFQTGSYYAWEREIGRTRYLFLMLDNGYHSGTPLDVSKESRRFRLSDEQRQWLQLQVRTHPDHVLMLTMHVPLTQDDMTRSVKAAVAEHPKEVFAFAGHTHTVDAVEDLELGNGRVLHQIRTPGLVVGKGNWRPVKLYEDRVEVFQTGNADRIAKTFRLSATPAAAVQTAAGSR